MAQVSARYLEGLLCPSRPLDDELVICRFPPVQITETGQEFLNLVGVVLAASPEVPQVSQACSLLPSIATVKVGKRRRDIDESRLPKHTRRV